MLACQGPCYIRSFDQWGTSKVSCGFAPIYENFYGKERPPRKDFIFGSRSASAHICLAIATAETSSTFSASVPKSAGAWQRPENRCQNRVRGCEGILWQQGSFLAWHDWDGGWAAMGPIWLAGCRLEAESPLLRQQHGKGHCWDDVKPQICWYEEIFWR